MIQPRRASMIVAQPVEIGPLYAGNTKPDLLGILTWDAGGYVDLTGATVTARVRRYDRTRRQTVGGLVASAVCVLQDATKGEALFRWEDAPVGQQQVPVDPGYYAVRWRVVFSGGGSQESQDAVTEVLPASP